jgi:hypothetical protein
VGSAQSGVLLHGGIKVRQAARVDNNHSEIVEVLEKMGCTVQSLAQLGHGVPDLLVFSDRHPQKTFLAEVKDGRMKASKRRLSEDERAWVNEWPGCVYVITDSESAVAAAYGHGTPAKEYQR